MMNWFLVVVVVVMTFAFAAANVYILVYFQHPDDKNTAYMPKLLVVFGLLLAEACVLLLPLDVANNSTAIGCTAGWNSACGNLDMETLWLIVFMAIAVFLVVLLPYSIYFYESDDDFEVSGKRAHRWLDALKLEIATLVVVGIVIAITYVTSSTSDIPYTVLVVNTTSANDTIQIAGANAMGLHSYIDGALISSEERSAALVNGLNPITTSMRISVSVPVYITALVSFVGWFAFSIFVGVGLVAMPLDLILAYFFRPKFIPADIYAQQKMLIQIRSLELIEVGKEIKTNMLAPPDAKMSARERRKHGKLDTITMNKFKQAVYLLEKDVAELKLCHEDYKNFNPLVPVGKLILGVFAGIISILWILQIIVGMLPVIPILPFLNDYFMWFDKWFPLFGTVSVGIFTMYLLMACIKGCFKFGMRCFCCALHPMEYNGTYMNSFLFNLALILLCCIPVVQFSNQAFNDYVRLTTIQTLMGIQLKYMKGFSFFWVHNVFLYAILIIVLLTTLYLAVRPRDTSSKTDAIRKKIEKQVRLATA
ncbi:unnamed protein product [Aphanomyces euteiches]|uniref:LMBR1-like membrane protein n=1 Tax=Aphanomyces euteiches TaxID=100861 RepID=A0A6G0X0P3_9STRA|nr:hypothetical protein Ae201684_009620 [Aphanomyces euteiches]KAH9085772.1 hypothetical protein Ae201684P_005473 [Aphanomyces euteiches]KAH9157865.1 hypothetical protein AeRB84_000337 [Aphanomyces euteiches]